MINLWKTDKWGFIAVLIVGTILLLWLLGDPLSFFVVALVIVVVIAIVKVGDMVIDRLNP